jgi:hypothetical protein
MPEAAIDEYRHAVTRQYKIRCATLRELLMEPVPKTKRVQSLSQQQFWFRVFAPSTDEVTALDRAYPLGTHGAHGGFEYMPLRPPR